MSFKFLSLFLVLILVLSGCATLQPKWQPRDGTCDMASGETEQNSSEDCQQAEANIGADISAQEETAQRITRSSASKGITQGTEGISQSCLDSIAGATTTGLINTLLDEEKCPGIESVEPSESKIVPETGYVTGEGQREDNDFI
ncbi:MAG: hypothetical protein HY544_02035 [Candidatus Diapherotrites archaeon]|uniref:Lipoprotein n=1 Tax=Candidatus Iainarchaeum sp. TaxID=3101447 RepID=A0A8T3YJQ1_9ARCH|nr:hypothetical protein [Candidatus Diapherotrites archaeon]